MIGLWIRLRGSQSQLNDINYLPLTSHLDTNRDKNHELTFLATEDNKSNVSSHLPLSQTPAASTRASPKLAATRTRKAPLNPPQPPNLPLPTEPRSLQRGSCPQRLKPHIHIREPGRRCAARKGESVGQDGKTSWGTSRVSSRE